MKRIHFVKLLLVAVLVGGSLNAWGAEEVYKTALFGSGYNSKSVSSYTGSFSATNNNFTVNLTNFNNNQNGWDYVKTGNKSSAAIGTIITDAAIDKAVTKIAITIDAITTSSVNSITLYSGTSKSDITTNEGTFSSAKGVQSIEIISPAANKFYKISFDCKKGSSNGLVTVSKVEYYIESSGSTETTYSVTFDAGENGTCSTTSLKETSQGSGVTLPSCTPKTGYIFDGWSTSSSATSADAGKAGEIYQPSEDCTLYAVYSAIQYTVTWVVGSNPSKTKSSTTQVSSGSKATPPDDLTLTGSEIGDCANTFMGWTDNTITSPQDTPPAVLFKDESPEAITANTIFYAVFAKPK